MIRPRGGTNAHRKKAIELAVFQNKQTGRSYKVTRPAFIEERECVCLYVYVCESMLVCLGVRLLLPHWLVVPSAASLARDG
jgi:hypothetical protein